MNRFSVVASVATVLLLAGCSSPVPDPQDLADELGELAGVASATGESLSGNPDQRSAAEFYVTLADTARPANVSEVVSTWAERAHEVRREHLTLIVAEPDAESAFILETTADPDAAGSAAARWFDLAGAARVRMTLRQGSLDVDFDGANPNYLLSRIPPQEGARLWISTDGEQVAALDADACTFTGVRGEELWEEWSGPGYCAVNDLD